MVVVERAGQKINGSVVQSFNLDNLWGEDLMAVIWNTNILLKLKTIFREHIQEGYIP